MSAIKALKRSGNLDVTLRTMAVLLLPAKTIYDHLEDIEMEGANSCYSRNYHRIGPRSGGGDDDQDDLFRSLDSH